MIENLSTAAEILLPMAQAVSRDVRRVYRERQAGQMPFRGGNDLLDRGLDETLARLRGGSVDDTWWQNLLSRIGQQFVAPDFLRKPALQEWLADEEVRTDVRALARARILGATTDNAEARLRLGRAYSQSTGEDERLAEGPIEVVLAILTAGYLGNIDSFLEPIAGMIQGIARESRETLDDVQRMIGRLGPDIHVVQAHSNVANRALDLLCKQRSLSPKPVHQELLTLAHRVTDGDLRHAEPVIRAEIYYWMARMHAIQPETLSVARQYLGQLRQGSPSTDTRIIEALILETQGDAESALQILRDIDLSDARATLFGTLARTRGAEAAVLWFDDQTGRNDANFLTGLGWSNVAVSLAKMGRWEEAIDRLAAAVEHWAAWPELAFREGIINVAMLFPEDWRQYALEMNPCYTRIQPVEGPEADRHRGRAMVCFERAKDLLDSIDQGNHAQMAQDCLLWLRLTDPDPEVAKKARQVVQEGMKDGPKAVHLLPIARTFDIEFDEAPLEGYLLQRERIGGLNRRERLAKLFLAERTLAPGDFSELLEREESWFSQVVHRSLLAGMRVEALANDGQFVKAREVLEEHRDTFIKYDYDRLRALIDTHEGNDPREQFEALYQQTGELIDLNNLINHLRRVGDWTTLLPLLRELFTRERTLANAFQLIEAMRRQPQPDYAESLLFLETNQDLVERDLDLTSERAWALSHVGRLKEAEAINHTLLESRNNPIDLLLETNLALQSGNWERFSGIVDRAGPQKESLEPNLLMRLASLAAEADQYANRALELARLAAAKAADDPQILLSAYMLGVQLGHEDETGARWLARAIELSSGEGPLHRVNIRSMAEEMLPKRRERARWIEQALLRGTIPLHAAAHEFHQPLSRLLIDLPCKNADQPDGRKRTVVPIISGARQPVRVVPSWAVGFDVSTLMVLHHLGLLKQTIDALQRVMLAPDIMVLLLSERRSVRFHQPSRARKAEEIRALIDRGDLKIAPSESAPPAWLVDEVGRDLAQLLEAARASGGRVVYPYPLHKLRTFGEVEADIREYAEYLMSTIAFTEILLYAGPD